MIGKVMEGFMDRAPREVSAALPMHKAAGADFSRPIGAEKQEMALRYARMVAGCRNFAAAASFAAKQKDIYEELCSLLKRYNEDLVKALKADASNIVATGQFEFCASLTALLFSEQEANCYAGVVGLHSPRPDFTAVLPERWMNGSRFPGK